MTTPEAFRRRQRIEGFFLLVVGIAVIASSIYFHERDKGVRDCVTRAFSNFTSVSAERSKLAEQDTALSKREAEVNRRESEATANILSIYAEAAGLVKKHPERPLSEAAQRRLRAKVITALLDYARIERGVRQDRMAIAQERASIQRERKKTPIPQFTSTTCR